ncbi:MAG TPA: nitroreductase family protein [Bacteroidales bacterium]|nr:nitroreductase family protein [Bacteroidales bacterium]
MKFRELVKMTRSYRRFHQEHRVSLAQLVELVELARISGSSANRQPLKFMIFNSEAGCNKIFPDIKWAGYLKDWDGPEEGERPSAYIVMLGDRDLGTSFAVDSGIAAQSIMLGATESHLGGCMIASINRDNLRKSLAISDRYEILLILALGKTAEKVIIEEMKDNDIKYWRDDKGIHHVPKRKLDDLIIDTA